MNDLAPEEKETLCVYDMRDRVWIVTTIVPKHIRRITKLHGPGTVLDKFGTMRWTLPTNAVQFPKRQATDPEDQDDLENPEPDSTPETP